MRLVLNFGSYKVRLNMGDSLQWLSRDGETKEEIQTGLMKNQLEQFRYGMMDSKAQYVYDVEENVVIEDNEVVLKHIPKLEQRFVSLSHSGLSPYEIGMLYGDFMFRISDADPSLANVMYDPDKHRTFDRERLKKWVIETKLPRDQLEWQRIYGITDPVKREREINKITHAITESWWGGNN